MISLIDIIDTDTIQIVQYDTILIKNVFAIQNSEFRMNNY